MKKKIVTRSLIAIVSIVFLIAVAGFIDFNRIMQGKPLIFPFHLYVEAVGGEENGQFQFSGLGYHIEGCTKESYSFHFGQQKKVSCFYVEVASNYK